MSYSHILCLQICKQEPKQECATEWREECWTEHEEKVSVGVGSQY